MFWSKIGKEKTKFMLFWPKNIYKAIKMYQDRSGINRVRSWIFKKIWFRLNSSPPKWRVDILYVFLSWWFIWGTHSFQNGGLIYSLFFLLFLFYFTFWTSTLFILVLFPFSFLAHVMKSPSSYKSCLKLHFFFFIDLKKTK